MWVDGVNDDAIFIFAAFHMLGSCDLHSLSVTSII